MSTSTLNTKGAPSGTRTRERLARTMRSLSIDTVGDHSSALSHVGLGSLHSSTTSSIGGLRMAQDFTHAPVLLSEVTALFAPVPAGVVIDATLGGAGHASALLEAHPGLSVVGIDRDPVARAAATERLAPFGPRAVIVDGTFSKIDSICAAGREGSGPWPTTGALEVVGILADLGVSSPQLDVADRGFSFAQDGPLDMRMDTTRGETASSYLDRVDEQALTQLLRENGEGKYARRIARTILSARPVESTSQLVDLVDRAVPRGDRRRGHVASRTFQALRIAVNHEMDELDDLLAAAVDLVAPEGVIAIISYHSGEDTRVKHTMREWGDGTCTCPPGLPCVCGSITRGSLLSRRAITAGEAEIERNPRSRSARLRAFEVGR